MNALKEKSFDFAVRIVNLYKFLQDEKKEYELAKQILRSGTSIGANIAEANVAQSRKDFFAKCYIAYKEANETEFWIDLLEATRFLTQKQAKSLKNDLIEIQKLLSSTLYTIRKQLKKQKEQAKKH